jgi:hypothetical protein
VACGSLTRANKTVVDRNKIASLRLIYFVLAKTAPLTAR